MSELLLVFESAFGANGSCAFKGCYYVNLARGTAFNQPQNSSPLDVLTQILTSKSLND